MILFIENRKIFLKWASKTYEYKYNTLVNSKEFEVIDLGDDLSNIDPSKYQHVIFGWHAIPIHKFYNEPKHSYYKKHVSELEKHPEISQKIQKFLNIPKRYHIIQDMHGDTYTGGIDALAKYAEQYLTDIITPYSDNPIFNQLQSLAPNIQYHLLPHHIDTNYFKNYNQPKTYDIMLFGNDSKAFYPFRNRLFKLILENKTKYKVDHIPRPRNYFKFNKNICNDALSKRINRAWLTVCTQSKYEYLLGKYFETSMSHSVVVGDMPNNGKDIWGHNYIHLSPDMSDQQILDVLDHALQDKPNLQQIAQNMDQVMTHYSLDLYPQKLLAALSDPTIQHDGPTDVSSEPVPTPVSESN